MLVEKVVEVVVIEEVADVVELDDVVDTVPRAYIPAIVASNKTITTITINKPREIAAFLFRHDLKIFPNPVICINSLYLSL